MIIVKKKRIFKHAIKFITCSMQKNFFSISSFVLVCHTLSKKNTIEIICLPKKKTLKAEDLIKKRLNFRLSPSGDYKFFMQRPKSVKAV